MDAYRAICETERHRRRTRRRSRVLAAAMHELEDIAAATKKEIAAERAAIAAEKKEIAAEKAAIAAEKERVS